MRILCTDSLAHKLLSLMEVIDFIQIFPILKKCVIQGSGVLEIEFCYKDFRKPYLYSLRNSECLILNFCTGGFLFQTFKNYTSVKYIRW